MVSWAYKPRSSFSLESWKLLRLPYMCRLSWSTDGLIEENVFDSSTAASSAGEEPLLMWHCMSQSYRTIGRLETALPWSCERVTHHRLIKLNSFQQTPVKIFPNVELQRYWKFECWPAGQFLLFEPSMTSLKVEMLIHACVRPS